MSAAHEISLYCLIVGDDPSQMFKVQIARTADVYDLKEAIKQKKAILFRDVDANYLGLYMVSVAEPYDENLRKVILSRGERLQGDDELSELFPEPPPKHHIHIILDYLTIVCWLRGSEPDTNFQISIPARATVYDLKDAIKQKKAILFRDVDTQHMCLYRISGAKDELHESLNKTHDGDPLQGGTLGSHFLDSPVLDPFCVVVEVVSSATSTQPFPLVHPGFGGADPIKAAREAFLRSSRKSPSDGSHPSAFRKTQRAENTQIPCGRPREPEEIIPVTLLHPVFGQFVDDCQTGTMTQEDNRFVGKLANVMSDLYEKEADRVQAVGGLFREADLDFRIHEKDTRTWYTMDAYMSLDSDLNLGPPYVIAEFKNEAAISASEPYMQAIAYYLEATRTFLYVFDVDKRNTSPGPYIVFAGAVWNLRPIVQVLSTPLAFHYHSTDTQNQLTVARHMAAFRKAVKTLREYHECLSAISEAGPGNTLSHDTLFPYRTEFKSLDDGSTKSICYTKQFEEDGKKRWRIFFGTLQEDRRDQICIKFTRRYSEEAHLHCAKFGHAPTLRGFEKLPGGWYMVVMDWLVGYDLLADLPETDRLPRSVFDAIREQLDILHACRLVHGDIRDTNLLVKHDDRTKFMIIDFDWAGQVGIVQYPPYVNHSDIERPDDARDGLPIKADHDITMLDIIIDMWAKK
ncbi:hypothetical protein HD554DRAFT_2287753 [Boletus coccyginus]|nr:hypothetical protein HD554DRAFT_2287753 [Boletus coccyginus]